MGQISPPNLATLARVRLARVARLGGEIWPNLATLGLSTSLAHVQYTQADWHVNTHTPGTCSSGYTQ